jgi:hypothetical protein
MQKYIEGPDERWDSGLVNDLAFIKKYRRYPFNRMTLMPLLSSAIFLLYILFVLTDFFTGRRTNSHNYPFLPYVVPLFLLVPVIISIGRYINLIKFRAIHTQLYLSENMKLLQRFLDHQRLVTFRHPEMPEVYQIISKNISAVGDDREVLIFIADDKRILVNSHYTSSRKWFRLMSPPTHEAEMIKHFMEWLESIAKTPTSAVVPKGFS